MLPRAGGTDHIDMFDHENGGAKMSVDVSVEWVPYKVVPQGESGFEVVLHGERLTDPMPEPVAVVLATTLAKEAATQGKLGIVARCTGVGEIVSAEFFEPAV
jgi:hypothetical protein